MFADGGDFTANAIGKKSQTVQCAIENSDMVNFLKNYAMLDLRIFFILIPSSKKKFREGCYLSFSSFQELPFTEDKKTQFQIYSEKIDNKIIGFARMSQIASLAN